MPYSGTASTSPLMRIMQVVLTLLVMLVCFVLGSLQAFETMGFARHKETLMFIFSLETSLVLALAYGWFFYATLASPKNPLPSSLAAGTLIFVAAMAGPVLIAL